MSRSTAQILNEPIACFHQTNDDGISWEYIVDEICRLPWEAVSSDEILWVAQAYYYFSIQFRENLEIALQLYPNDQNLLQLFREECDTDNLSPWPQIVNVGERVNHDEFMRRLLTLQPIEGTERIAAAGLEYLECTRRYDDLTRAMSIVSYEDGGLSKIFSAFLQAPDWSGQAQQAFKHFLDKHLVFDNDPTAGHGALCRHLKPDGRVAPLWRAFKNVLLVSVPVLSTAADVPPISSNKARAALPSSTAFAG
jgi:hypothetical protein